MVVLSLFDGCAMTYQALKNAGIAVTKYYSSEVDKYAIEIAKKNHPDIVCLGDVTKWRKWKIKQPDLIVAGSPCQGFSLAGKQLNFQDERSRLFFEFVDIVNHYKPSYFLLENVKMKSVYSEEISRILGVDHVFINSSLVSAQNRQRLYWCNWQVEQPKDRGIVLKDVLQDFENIDESFYHSQKAIHYMQQSNEKWQQAGKRRADKYTQTKDTEKAFTLTANFCKGVPYNYFLDSRKAQIIQKPHGNNPGGLKATNGKTPALTSSSWEHNNHLTHDSGLTYRKLTPIECERLQTLPDNYTEGVSNTQRFKMLGNGFTVAVIEHLFKEMLKGKAVVKRVTRGRLF